MAINYDDAMTLKYFHEEKGDIRRASTFDEVEAQLKEEYPEFFLAEQQLMLAQLAYNAVVEKIFNDSMDKEYGY